MANKFVNIFHCKTLQNLPKIDIFGLKIYHLATLLPTAKIGFLLDGTIRAKSPKIAAGLPDGVFSDQKIPIWVNFGRPWNGKGWCIQWPFEIYLYSLFNGHLVI
jgi:hypothetical protein